MLRILRILVLVMLGLSVLSAVVPALLGAFHTETGYLLVVRVILLGGGAACILSSAFTGSTDRITAGLILLALGWLTFHLDVFRGWLQ